MKKGGLLLLAVILVLAFASFVSADDCCSNPNQYGSCQSITEGDVLSCCPFDDGAYDIFTYPDGPVNYDDCVENFYYQGECVDWDQCSGNNQCCLSTDAGTLGQCYDGGTCSEPYLVNTGVCNYDSDECAQGCCCEVNPNVAHDDVSKFYCNNIIQGTWEGVQSDCDATCDVNNGNPECNDGIDNDGDGKCDWNGCNGLDLDPSCSDANDNTESDCGNAYVDGDEQCDDLTDSCNNCMCNTDLGYSYDQNSGLCLLQNTCDGVWSPPETDNVVCDGGENCYVPGDTYECTCEDGYVPSSPQNNFKGCELNTACDGSWDPNEGLDCDSNVHCTNCICDLGYISLGDGNCGIAPAGEQICNDNIDNDNDGKTDCADDDCADFPDCGSWCSGACTTDENCEGYYQWADPDCLCVDVPGDECPSEQTACLDGTEAEQCSEVNVGLYCDDNFNLINKCYGVDGIIDTADDCGCPDGLTCQENGVCSQPQEDCTNGVDDDGDTLVDCADDNCWMQECSSSNSVGCKWEADYENNIWKCCPEYMGEPNTCNERQDDEYQLCGQACPECSESEAPAPTELVVNDKEYSPSLELNWNIKSTCFGDVDHFEIKRCKASYSGEEDLGEKLIGEAPCIPNNPIEENFHSQSPTNMRYLDSIGENFAGSLFCYQVVAHYKGGFTKDLVNNDGEKVVYCQDLGNKECFDNNAAKGFCIFGGEPDYNDYTIYKCNAVNNEINIEGDTDCHEDVGPNSRCMNDPFTEDHEAMCKEPEGCSACNDPLGVFGYVGVSSLIDGTSCDETLACYYDESPTANVDYYDTCKEMWNEYDSEGSLTKEGLGCYGYMSEEACTGFQDQHITSKFNNKCLNRNCVWENISEELGVGVCHEVDDNLDKCELCSGDYGFLDGEEGNGFHNDLQKLFNKRWDQVLGACTPKTCMSFGNCFPKDGNSDGTIFTPGQTSSNYNDEICLSNVRASCDDYTVKGNDAKTKEYCTSYDTNQEITSWPENWGDLEASSSEINLDLNDGSQWAGTNIYKQHSKDFFRLGFCALKNNPVFGTTCINDPDNDGDKITGILDREGPITDIDMPPALSKISDDDIVLIASDTIEGVPCDPTDNSKCEGVGGQGDSGSYVSMTRLSDDIFNDEDMSVMESLYGDYELYPSDASWEEGLGMRNSNAYFLNKDGVNSNVVIDSPMNEIAKTDSFTFSAWIYPVSSSQNQVIMMRGNDIYGENEIILSIDYQMKPSLRINDIGEVLLSQYPVNLNEWNHVVGTYDGSEMCVYLNGQQTCKDASGDISEFEGVSLIGKTDTESAEFEGMIDDLGIWNVSLQPQKVENIYAGGEGVEFDQIPTEGLLAYFNFEDEIIGMCYDYLKCQACMIQKDQFSEYHGNKYWIKNDSFEGECQENSPGESYFEVSTCPKSLCYEYPTNKITDTQGFESYYGEKPGGHYNFFYYSKDKADHLEVVKSKPFYLDMEGPKIWMDPEKPAIQPGELPEDPNEQLTSNLIISVKVNEAAYCWDKFNSEAEEECPDSNNNSKDCYQSNHTKGDYDNEEPTSFFTEGFVSQFTDYPDGLYDYDVYCKDQFGNLNNKTFTIRVDADTRIAEVSPLVPINLSRVNLTVTTRNNVTCHLYNGIIPVAVNQEGNITSEEKEGYEVFVHRFEVNHTQSKKYSYDVVCDYIPIATDEIEFTLDKLPPVTTPKDNSNENYIFADNWLSEHGGIYLSTRDPPPNISFTGQEQGFGSSVINFCVDSYKCDPSKQIEGNSSYGTIEPDRGPILRQITVPRYLCYSSVEKTSYDHGANDGMYYWLPKDEEGNHIQQGGLSENLTCQYVLADELTPVVKIAGLENYTDSNYPFPIPLTDLTLSQGVYYINLSGQLIDYAYDTDDDKIENWGVNGVLTNENNMQMKTPYWNNQDYTEEGYIFGNFTLNASFALSVQDDRPQAFNIYFRAQDKKNYYAAVIEMPASSPGLAKLSVKRFVNGQPIDIISPSSPFAMPSALGDDFGEEFKNYTAEIGINGNVVSFTLYDSQESVLKAISGNTQGMYKKGYIGAEVIDSPSQVGKIFFNRVWVYDNDVKIDNSIYHSVYKANSAEQLTPLVQDNLGTYENFSYQVGLIPQEDTNLFRLYLGGSDKAHNIEDKYYYVYLATKGPEFTSLKFLGGVNDGKEVNNETHYEMNSQDNVSFILSVKDEDFNEMHINITDARVDVANISTEMTYVGVSGNNEKTYYWNVSLDINSLGTGIYDFIVTAEDEVGNYNSKTYYLNVSDTIAPTFNMSVYRDANFTEFVNTTIGLGRYYVKVNASELSRLDELSFTNDFNSQTIKATCGDQGNYVTKWECTFIVPYLGFWGKVGEVDFAINGSDIAGNEQEEINPSLYLFNGIGPNYIYFDPSFADEEQSPNFYHNVYSDKMKYYGEKHDDLDEFVTSQDSLFISGFSLGAKSVSLETEDASANYNIPPTVQLEDDYAIMSYKREKGALELSLDGDLRGTSYATPGNYVGFVNDDLIRTSYENYNQYYRIESFYYQSGNSYVTIYPALEFNVSAGETLAVYDKLTPADYFGLYSPVFKSGYNEFYAKASDGYSYSVSPHYYIMLDKVAPLFVTSDYYPFDGWYVNNYDENENQYKLTNINLTVIDSLPSSGIYLENTVINVTYEGNLVYSGPLTGVEEHNEGIHVVYKLSLDLNTIDYQDDRINGGVYHIDAKVMDGAMNPAYFSFGFTAINGMEDYPFLTLVKENGTRYNNSYDLYPYPNPNYFVKGIVNSVQNSQTDFELKFNENVFNLNVLNDLSPVTCIDNLDYTYNCSFGDMFAGLNPDVEKEIIHNMNITFENEDGEVRSVVYKFVVDSAPVTLGEIVAPEKIKSNSSFDIGLGVQFTYDSFPINVSMVISNGTDEFNVGKTIVLLGEDVSFANAFIPENVSEGNYTLIATAVDQAGNSVKKYKTIVVDNTPPEISVTSVESMNPEKKTLDLDGWRTTDDEVLVRLSTNENLSLLCYDDGSNGCDITKLEDVSGNTFIFNIGLVGLNQAEVLNSINFIAKDLAGNQQEINLNVITDHLGPQVQDVGGDLTFENPLYVEFNENVSNMDTYIFKGDERFNLINIENGNNTFFKFVKGAILENGTYSWAFNVTDSLGNLAVYNENWNVYTFVYEGESFKIELERPTYGWSAEPVFDLMIKTNYPAKCRYSYAGNVYNYDNFPNNFTTTDGYAHYVYGYEMNDSKEKIYVKCKDEFGGQSPAGENNKEFTLVWNDNQVEISDAYASPYAIVDETNGKYVTEFNVVTDIPSLCRYNIDGSNEFDLMPEANTFPGIGEKEEGTGYVHKVDMDKQNAIDTYVYDVSCKSLANISNIAPAQIEFKIDPFAELEVGILSPKNNVLTSDENEEFVLRLKANRNADCQYQFNDGSSSVSFNLEGNVEKEFDLGSFHSNRWDEGTVKLDINCTSDQGNFNVQRLFTLDTSLGKFGLEVYEDSGRNEKIDPELDTLGLGTYYLIVSSDEPTTMELSLKSDFNHDNEYEEIQANCPNPDGRQKQRYCEIDIPYEGYWNYSGRMGFVALGNDSVGNIQTGIEPSLYNFNGNLLNYKMNMTLPTYGWSADETFKVEIETSLNAKCRYDFSSNIKHYNLMQNDFVDSANGLKHTINSYNISELGNKIYVTCVDEYGRQFPTDTNRMFELTWDDDAPTIISATADPSVIIDDNGQGQYETQFKVTTNKPTLCRYDYGNGIDNYTLMSPDNQFVFPAMKNSDTGYYENTVIINNQTVPNNYSYNISCSSYADVISSPAQIDFKIDPSYGLLLELVSPDSTYITSDSSENIVYTLKTNKGAECYWYLNTTKVPIVFTMKANKEEKINIGTLKKEGWVEFTATCTADNVERTINALVALDTSVPKISNVTVDDISCRDSRLEINKILFENGISPIEAVEYRLLKFSNNEVLVDWKSTSNTQNIKVDEYDNGSHFGLTEGTKYYFEVRANNTVVNGWSPVVDSNSILVDLNNEKCVRCGDGECNALFEDCSTCASDCGVCGPECENGQKDVGETGIDCGGSSCPKCTVGDSCSLNSDCESDVCENGVCALPLCKNNVLNSDNGESDIDCGGNNCDGCSEGKNCFTKEDCAGDNYCNSLGVCTAPTCSDNNLNQDETGIDCGGTCALVYSQLCSLGDGCNSPSDCESGYCDLSTLTCAKAGCDDNIKNGDETGRDCGGSCGPCDDDEPCEIDSDCKSGDCKDKVCVTDKDKDTDGDGLPDWWETENGLNPNDPSDAGLDKDGDGLSNYKEYTYQYGSLDPNNPDTDGDGVFDMVEIQKGTDPLDASSFPKSSSSWWSIILLIVLIIGVLGGGGYYAYLHYYTPPVPPMMGAGPKPRRKQMFSSPRGQRVVAPPKRVSLFKQKEVKKNTERSKLFDSFNTKEEAVKAEIPSKEVTKVDEVKIDTKGNKINKPEWIDLTEKANKKDSIFKKLSKINKTSNSKSVFDELESVKDETIPEVRVANEKLTLREKMGHDSLNKLRRINSKDSISTLKKMDDGKSEGDVFSKLKKMNKRKK